MLSLMPNGPAQPPPDAATVHVHLQHGFADDRVEVHVGETEVFRSDGVTTSLLTGLAAEADIQVLPDETVVRVQIPSRGIDVEHAVGLTPCAEHWVGVGIEADKVRFSDSDRSFFYG